ncbi:MAG TPA: hypothetical protein VGR26_14730 [Acidimicrobiales bacterium]|nr:hypothetical protein [Acidimicrobiales bacterium]
MVDAKAGLFTLPQLQIEDPLRGFEIRSASETVEEMQSPTVRRVVRARLGHDPTVYFEVRADNIIEIHARAIDPLVAAEDATGFAEAYVDWQRDRRAAELLNAEAAVHAEVARVRTQLQLLDKPLPDTGPVNSPQLDIAASVARSEQVLQMLPIQRQLADLNVHLEMIQAEKSSFGTSGGGYLVRAAVTPTKPFFANPLWMGALASALMLIFALRVLKVAGSARTGRGGGA